jgi:hypothetical protein
LTAAFAAHVQGLSKEELPDTAFDGEAAQRFDVFATSAAFESFEALRSNSEFVADSKADPLLTQVEGQDASGIGHISIVGVAPQRRGGARVS